MKYLLQIGTATATDENGIFDQELFCDVARQIASLWQQGVRFAVIPGGALSLGYQELGWGVYQRTETNIADLQHASSVGQSLLMAHLYMAFADFKLIPGHFPYTHDQLETPTLRSKVKIIVDRALDKQSRVVPILFGHDISTEEEIKKVSTQTDYDVLFRIVGKLLQPDRAVVMTNTDGIHTSRKSFSKQVNERGIISHFIDVSQFNEIRKDLGSCKKDSPDYIATMGLLSKYVEAINLSASITTWIVNAREKDVLLRIHQGEEIGTMVCLKGNSEKNKLSRK